MVSAVTGVIGSLQGRPRDVVHVLSSTGALLWQLIDGSASLDELANDVVLEDLDLDSLALIELSLTLQKRFGIVLAGDDITPQHTVGELADIVADAQAKAPR